MRPTVLLLALVASATGADSAKEAVTTYQVEGVLREIRDGGSKVLIAHKAIPGFMDAMTMEFTVHDRSELAGLAAGDALIFRLSVTPNRGWIDRIRKTGKGGISNEGMLSNPGIPPLRPGDPMPDCALLDAFGKSLRLSDFKGQAVALTFIFTRCPYPEFCPKLTGSFAAAQQQLSTSRRLRDGSHLLSVSIDPEYDNPERLRAYAQAHGADPMIWSFATGAPAEIEKLAAVVGVSIGRNGGTITHDLRTLIIDAEGRVRRVLEGNNWSAEDLVGELEGAIDSKR